MAAVTPTAVKVNGPVGMETEYQMTFADTTDATDTWASGFGTRVTGFWAQPIETPTSQTASGVAVAYSAGTFTFTPGEDNMSFYLFVRASGA